MARRNALRERYRRVMDHIAAAAERCGRRPADVICIAVTKEADPPQIRQLIELGHQDFGENRVQQLQHRFAMTEEVLARHRLMGSARGERMPDSVRWHMVGHLQRNKVRTVLPLVKLIHSVDSMRLAEEIEAQAARDDREVEVLLQVNASGEPSKFGLAPASVPHLAEQLQSMIHLRLRGLMTIAPLADDPRQSRPTFERTAELFQEMRASGRLGEPFNILSMGMTNDYEVAIECGANIVRIGRALFDQSVEVPVT